MTDQSTRDELLAYHLARIELLRMEKRKADVDKEFSRQVAEHRSQPVPALLRKQAG